MRLSMDSPFALREVCVRTSAMNVIFVTLSCLLLLSGCTKAATRATDKGLFHITLNGKETVLKFGRNEIDLHVTDDKGADVEGAQVEITPWMPEHDHGALWPPTVVEKGKGLYRAVIPLTMAGHWELRVRIQKGDRRDSTVLDFPDVVK